MILRPFTASDLPEAGRIALDLWGNEYTEPPASVRPGIYRYLASYYYCPESPYNFCVEDAGRLLALLLAYPASFPHRPPEPDAFVPAEFSPLVRRYRAYLEGNRRKELACVRPDEVILALFASTRKGCGKMLFDHFSGVCRRDGVPGLLLWTDDTCDFDYYERHGFEEAGRMPTDPPLADLTLTTYLYRKSFKRAEGATDETAR